MKKLFALILAAFLVLGLVACTANPQSEVDQTAQKVQFTVIVTYKDKTEKIFLFESAPGKLGDALEAEGFLGSEGADDGMFHTVDGEKADVLTQNGKIGMEHWKILKIGGIVPKGQMGDMLAPFF